MSHIFPVPKWLIKQAVLCNRPIPSPTDYIEIVSQKTNELLYRSNPGPQTYALQNYSEELLVGGRRGGGKSAFLKVKPAMGDPSLPEDDPARSSMLNDRSYRGLFLRETYQDMSEFLEEAIEFYKHFGGKPVGDPKSIKFDTGAKIYFNHLGDEQAYEKYKGWNLTFIGIEELTQIKTLKRYLKLRGSLRAVERLRIVRQGNQIVQKVFPALRTQLCSTTNPDGPGSPWCLRRFVEVRGKSGQFLPNGEPMRDTFTNADRIFIPFPIEANPYLDESKPAGRRYRANLLAQDEVTRKQWMDGDWHAGTGIFFRDYRPDGPIGKDETEKFPWAFHITKPVEFRDWWYRWGSGDWGYDHPSAFHKAIRNESDGRIHVYDELVMRQVGSFEMGTVIAKWWQPDLMRLKSGGRDPCVTIYLGQDLFRTIDATKTRAEEMEGGIKEVLGPMGAIVLRYDDTERAIAQRDPARAAAIFAARRKEFVGQMCIALKPIHIVAEDAWAYTRDIFRFRPVNIVFKTELEKQQYLDDILKTDGREAYEIHAQALKDQKPEILPKLLIWPNCKGLDRCLRTTQVDDRADNDLAKETKRNVPLKRNADDQGKDGDDELDSFRNLVVAYKEIQTEIPKSYFVSEKLTNAVAQHEKDFGEPLNDPTRLAMISMTQSHKWDKMHVGQAKGFTPPRASSQRHRIAQPQGPQRPSGSSSGRGVN